MLCSDEAQVFGQSVHLGLGDIEDLSLGNAHKKLSQLAYLNAEVMEGNSSNLIDCAVSVDSTNCYRSSVVEYSKYCGYSFWPRNCQNLFGADSSFDSSFSIHINSCTQIVRSFEIDCCGYCSDCYFCHNCENVRDSMFCFNIKNKNYAIGNAIYPVDQYKKFKSAILEQIVTELERNKSLKWSIYNLGAKI